MIWIKNLNNGLSAKEHPTNQMRYFMLLRDDTLDGEEWVNGVKKLMALEVHESSPEQYLDLLKVIRDRK